MFTHEFADAFGAGERSCPIPACWPRAGGIGGFGQALKMREVVLLAEQGTKNPALNAAEGFISIQ
jgi:hypothetical protein